MPTPIITLEIDNQIRDYSKQGFTTKEIAGMLRLKYQTVASHMINNKIPRNYGRTVVGRPAKKIHVIGEGYFNEHERENWLI